MSDMYTWLKIMENGDKIPFKEGESVQLTKRVGGGVGQYSGYSPERGTVTITIKGEPQEFRLDDIEASIDPGASYYQGNSAEQRYGEVDGDQHYIPDRPEFEAGQMVKIDNLYGQGNGEGFGVFVAYALDGQSAICNVDSEDKTVPIEYISLAQEESEDCFCDTGNDGALSPMSFGDEQRLNIKDGKEDVTMEDLEKWMQVVENDGEIEEVCDTSEELEESKDCDCGSYDCNTCFPDENNEVSEDVVSENEIFDIVYELAENDEFEDDLEEALDDDEEEIEEMRINDIQESDKWDDDVAKRANNARIADGGERKRDPESLADKRARWSEQSSEGVNEEGPEDEFDTGDSSAEFATDADAMVDIGDDEFGGEPAPDLDKEMGTAEVGGPSEDVSELIAKIAYVQDMGMSMTDRFYDPEKLTMMKPEMIQRIHSKVVGMEESASGGASGAGGIADASFEEGTEHDNVGRARADKETRQAADKQLGDFDPNEFDFDEEEEALAVESWEDSYNKVVAESEEDEDDEEVTEEKDEEDDSDEKEQIEESVASNRKEAVNEGAVDADVARAMKALFE